MHVQGGLNSCFPKCEGGLGLKNLITWNKASISFQVWRIIQPTSNSLRARDEAIRYIKYHVGNSNSFLLWHDPWAQNGPLIQSSDSRIISIVESTSLAQVSTTINDGRWQLHPSNHTFAMNFRSLANEDCNCYSYDTRKLDEAKCVRKDHVSAVVFCVKFSRYASYVISGSDDTNLRLWKAKASEQLGVFLPRESNQHEYRESAKNRYKHLPEVKRIVR
ncbi:hypothetical protein POM88_004914 [Heracleum sosnowskyi]|uniref:Sof1-like protein domain-containing protein n=1 Tax=Heracleum sosnowskyi TaxID=360622 RepID=A0AAD8JJA7_9APIA|nr:hypothetical protein POM88_004914 [Heracleum sosnowskyi]